MLLALFAAVFPAFSQQKYGLIFSRAGSSSGHQRIVASNNIKLIRSSLLSQGFSSSHITIDSNVKNRAGLFQQMTKVTNEVKRGDVVFIYFDLETLYNETEGLQFKLGSAKTNELANFEMVASQLQKIGEKINDKSIFFLLVDLDTGVPNLMASRRPDPSFNIISSALPGQGAEIVDDASVFARATANSFKNISEGNLTYAGFFTKLKNEFLSYTTKQQPKITGSGLDRMFLSGMYTKYPLHFIITEKTGDREIVINAGSRINLIEGSIINIYKAYQDTTRQPFITGRITKLSGNRANVSLEKSLTGDKEIYWAYISAIPIAYRKYQLTFNRTYAGTKHKEIFEKILATLSDNGSLYSNFVTKGGDLQIGNIETIKDSLEITLINPQSGQISSVVKVKNASELSPMIEFCVRLAKYEHLLGLRNEVPGQQVLLDMRRTDGAALTEKENGYDILYEGDEVKLTITNNNNERIYYALIDLTQDKNFAFFGDAQGFGEQFVVEPHGESIVPLTVSPPFGRERIKVITSNMPFSIAFFEPDYYSRGAYRGFQNVNIQDYDFEARSALYKKPEPGIVRTTLRTKFEANPQSNNTSFAVVNPTNERVYFNLLRQADDGSYDIIFPGPALSAADCFVENGGSAVAQNFLFKGVPKEDQQLITVYADRPFNMAELMSNEKSLNDLIADIARNRRITGTALNKIGLQQELYTPAKAQVSRAGESIVIKLVTPKISNDRGGVVTVAETQYAINGFAIGADNKPVKSLRINGTATSYDTDLKFFEHTFTLSNGINKIVIEAADDKNFTVTRVIDIELKGGNITASGQGKNYFLGVGIDAYRAWPALNNAKNDVVGFSSLMKSKFGFDNVQLLLDTAATRKNIINGIRNFLKTAGPNDNIIIYLSGHGNEDQLADGGYYFIPQEADADDVSSAVNSSDIIDNFKKIKAKRCLLIVDACYSGMITNNVNTGSQPITSANDNQLPENAGSKWIITSGRATKVADGVPGKNSPFATVFINYLRDHSDEPSLKMSKLIEFLKEKVHDLNKLQEPLGVPIEGRGEWIFKMPAK